MTIPKPGEMKQTILDYLVKAKRPVKLSDLAEEVARHFKVTEEEQAERNPSGGKKFSNLVGSVVTTLGKNGDLKSTGHGFWEISTTPPPPLHPPTPTTSFRELLKSLPRMLSTTLYSPNKYPGLLKTHTQLCWD